MHSPDQPADLGQVIFADGVVVEISDAWTGLVDADAGVLLSGEEADVTTTIDVALSDFSALRIGFLTNALNPKTMVFVVSPFMQVVQPSTPMQVQIGYGAFISGAHVMWFALVALFTRIVKEVIREYAALAEATGGREFGSKIVSVIVPAPVVLVWSLSFRWKRSGRQ